MEPKRRDIADLLGAVPMFVEGGRGSAARLARHADVVEVPRGQVLFHPDEPSEGVYFVVSGQVKLAIRTPAGAELVVSLIGPGESFGESTTFLGLPHIVEGEALVSSRLVHIPTRAIMVEVKRSPDFARRIILALSTRLHHMISGLEGYALRSGTQRVAGYLLGQLDQGAQGAGRALTLPAQKRIIASQLNLTQEHFSRILHELVAKGLIEVRGNTVTVFEREALQAEATGAPGKRPPDKAHAHVARRNPRRPRLAKAASRSGTTSRPS